MLLILLPLCGNIDYVLGLWLVDVPAHTANFVVLVLLYSLLDGILTPIAIGVFAQGEIKAYEIALCIIYAVNFIASYVCLKLGMAQRRSLYSILLLKHACWQICWCIPRRSMLFLFMLS